VNELSREARQLIALGRAGDDPTERDEQRVARSLAARRALGAAVAASGIGVAKSTLAATLVATVGKHAAVIAVTVAVGATALGGSARRVAELVDSVCEPRLERASPRSRTRQRWARTRVAVPTRETSLPLHLRAQPPRARGP